MLCGSAADMSNPNEQIMQPKQRIGKFVTFSQECDNAEKNRDNPIVFPKTKVPGKVTEEDAPQKYFSTPTFPTPEEVIELPDSPSSTDSNDRLRNRKDWEDAETSWKRVNLSNFSRIAATNRRKMSLRRPRFTETNQMTEILKKLRRIHQLRQMDDLTALCKVKMSISSKETEKMDEDSID